MSPLNKNGLRDKLFKLNESIKIIEELLGRDEVIKDNILKILFILIGYFNRDNTGYR